jgi:uncharacterized protein (TIRG00374 family)
MVLGAAAWYLSQHWVDLAAAVSQLRSARPLAIVASAFVMTVVMVSNGAMYRRALGSVGVAIAPTRATSLAAASHLLNTVAPSGGLASVPLFMREARQGKHSAGAGVAGYLAASLVSRAALVATGVAVLPWFFHSSLGVVVPLIAVGLYALITGAKIALTVLVSSCPERSERWFDRLYRLIPARRHGQLRPLDDSFVSCLRDLKRGPGALVPALGWSILGKLAGGVSVWIAIVAVGGDIRPGPALAAYSLATTAGALSLVPGGVGVVDAALAGSLAGFGVPFITASAATVVYRLFQLWVPLAIGVVGASGLDRSHRLEHNLPVALEPALAG